MPKQKKETQIHSKQIESLVKSYKKQIDKTVQRSELLKRNTLFNQELTGFINRVGNAFFQVFEIDRKILEEEKEDNILIKLDYPKEDFSDTFQPGSKKKVKKDRYWKNNINLDRATCNPPKNLSERIFNKKEILNHYQWKWAELCNRWHIEDTWNGDLNTLEQHARQNVEIYDDWEHNTQKNSILIKINEWATLDDIKSVWSEIEILQNEFWGKKERRSNFTRDLIWYDLSTQHKMTPSNIATLWNIQHPKDIDLLIIRRFRKEIDPNDFGGKIIDDEQLLKEIRSGALKIKYKEYFDEEREYYITGKIKKGSKYITTSKPFVDVIKKAIQRMRSQIKESSMPPLPEERTFIGLPPQRIL